MIPVSSLANHLWQTTVFGGAAGLVTLALRENRAQVRHSIWQAASLKFLVPFSLLIGIGNHLGWQGAPTVSTDRLSFAIEKLSRPFQAAATQAASSTPASIETSPVGLLLVVWFCGCAAVLIFWWLRWRRIATTLRSASPLQEGREFEMLRSVQRSLDIGKPIDLLSSTSLLEPGVFGIVRPALVLPAGIAERLTGAQLKAVITHEVCHVRRQDNLAAAIHMLVEGLFWFHPLVWWLGSRLVEERERACDEEVLRLGSEPVVYAEGILKVCEFYFESPLLCAAGVTGANLKKRIEDIMSSRLPSKLDVGRRLLLAAAGVAALSSPVAFGILHSSAVGPLAAMPSQIDGAAPSFEVASIKPSQRWKAGGEGRTRETIDQSPVSLTLRNVTLGSCVQMAYGVRFYQVSGPESLTSERYDILAKAARPVSPAQMRLMLRTLLASRFKLELHRENKELPVYALVVARNGQKLENVKDAGRPDIRVSNGSFIFQNVSMPDFAEKLSDLRTIDRPVVDRTGIQGVFDITLKSAASAMLENDGPSIFTLIQEQLGLRLEAKKAPVEILVVDHAEKVPTEN